MKIAIIGSGRVGTTLGEGWRSQGHEVLYGSRTPSGEKLSIADAAAAADVVVLTVPWEAAESALQSAGDLSGKTLLDCTNPILPQLAGLSVGTTTSGGELVQSWAPAAHVVKIFNTTGFDNMANPRYGDTRVTMLYCGDDVPAKKAAVQLASDLGFDPVDAGPLRQARLLEPFAMLWISLAVFQGMGRDFALQIVRRP